MLTFKIHKTPDFEKVNRDYFIFLINMLNEKELISKTIDEVIITDNIQKDVFEYCKDRPLKPNLTRSREFKSVGKTIDFEGKTKIFFDAEFINVYSSFSAQVFVEQFLEVLSEDYIRLKYPKDSGYLSSTSLSEIVEKFLFRWSCKVLTNDLRLNFNYKQALIHNELGIYVNSFKRNIRKLHYRYQEDVDIDTFWVDVITELDNLIRRCLEVHFDNGSFENSSEFKEILQPLVIEVVNQSNNIIDEKEVSTDLIKSHVKAILSICYISNPEKGSVSIKISDSPKTLFKNRIVDTEPRIVAFLDILGFSAIIDEYDNSFTSNLLNDLHETLEQAINFSIDQFIVPSIQSNLKNYLEYRMFSDCICISLPYIEFGNDFHIQFHSLAHVVNSYQLSMMQKGFFVRGGISMGSYYADKNMIFSGGLVKAYTIENSVKHPIIAIDKIVLERLRKNQEENFKGLFFNDLLVKSIDNPIIVFLNPFNTLDNFNSNLDFLQNAFEEIIPYEKEHEYSELLKTIISHTKSLTSPIFEFVKNQASHENIEKSKNIILGYILEQIEKHSSSTQSGNIEDKKYAEKIIEKYHFLKLLIEWSQNENNCFVNYSFG